jgi:hypothetical protein
LELTSKAGEVGEAVDILHCSLLSGAALNCARGH